MILGICKIFKDSISFLLKKRIPGTLPRNGTFFRVGETVPALPPLTRFSLQRESIILHSENTVRYGLEVLLRALKGFFVKPVIASVQ